ncbi:EamA family transporter [Teichococcus aestuarii]|uniref:EamA family transporter n=1 Tax=Teichococcus aestuarii TaxID=568898 RepID=UPI0036212A83
MGAPGGASSARHHGQRRGAGLGSRACPPIPPWAPPPPPPRQPGAGDRPALRLRRRAGLERLRPLRPALRPPAFTPWDVGALRYAGSLLAGLALVARFGWPRLPWRRALGLMAGAAFGFPLAAYWGFSFAPAAHGGVIMTGLLPFATALLAALFLGERFSRGRALSLAVVALGIGLLASDTFGTYPGAGGAT